MGTSAAAGSVLPRRRLRQPDSALRALLLASLQAGAAARALEGIEGERVGSGWRQPAIWYFGRNIRGSDCGCAPSGDA